MKILISLKLHLIYTLHTYILALCFAFPVSIFFLEEHDLSHIFYTHNEFLYLPYSLGRKDLYP